MTRLESAKANCATAKATPCFFWFSWSLVGSHSNLAFAIRSDYHGYGHLAIYRYGWKYYRTLVAIANKNARIAWALLAKGNTLLTN